MSTTDLPLVNAVLNGTSTFCLLLGLWSIQQGDTERHKRFMVAALTVSVLFLVSYLTYHSLHGSTKFQGQGGVRTLYFAILISHTILAAVVAPLVIVTVRFAIRRQFERHKKWARVTFPIWLYVSVTGVLIYMMLYQWFA